MVGRRRKSRFGHLCKRIGLLTVQPISDFLASHQYVTSVATLVLRVSPVVVVLVIAAIVLLDGPGYFLNAWQNHLTPKEFLELNNSYRATLAQAFGGLILLGGLYFTALQASNAEKSRQLAQEGQITERFTRAVDQLGRETEQGQPNIPIRLGAIYALERIAKQSSKDYWPIMEILTAYVRQVAPRDYSKPLPVPTTGLWPKPRADVQAVLNVIRRRGKSYGYGERDIVDLSGTDLTGAKLNEVNLDSANLDDVCLDGAFLVGASLSSAWLAGGSMRRAGFSGATLIGTHFEAADLEGASFHGAGLEDAIFCEANLRKTDFANSIGLTPQELEGCRGFEEAILPPVLAAWFGERRAEASV